MASKVWLVGGPLDGERVEPRPGHAVEIVEHDGGRCVVHRYEYGSDGGVAFYRHTDATAYWPDDLIPHAVRYRFDSFPVEV